MAVGDVFELDFHYHVHQRPLTINTWWEEVVSPSTPSGAAQDLVSAAVAIGLHTAILNILSVQAAMDMLKAYKRVNAGGGEGQLPPGQQIFTSSAIGQRSGEALPGSSCLVINFQQAAESAKANGRMFLAGISEDDTDGNIITNAFRDGALATFVGDWTGMVGDIILGSDGGEYRQGMMSKLLSLLPYTSAKYGTFLDAVDVNCNPILRTQRRRASRWERATVV